MVESHSQPASVSSEFEVETGPSTQSITILGLRFSVQSPYSVGHICTKGEAGALNQKRLESIRNKLAVTAKDRALTQADVDAYAASYAFGERTARRRTNDPVEAEALELARRLVRKKEQSRKENTEAARELLRKRKGGRDPSAGCKASGGAEGPDGRLIPASPAEVEVDQRAVGRLSAPRLQRLFVLVDPPVDSLLDVLRRGGDLGVAIDLGDAASGGRRPQLQFRA